MAGDKPVDLPSELDSLLRREMAIAPSPGFIPRVRERIRTPQQARWNWIQVLAGAAAVAVCAVAVAVAVMADMRVTSPSPPAPPLLAVAPAIARPGSLGPPVLGSSGPGVAALRNHALRTRAAQARPPALAVVIDARQHAALTEFIRMLSDGRLTEDAFKNTTVPSMQPIRDQVVPIGVKPMEPNAIGGGVVLQPEK